MQHRIRRPRRLKDRLTGSPRDQPRVARKTCAVKSGGPELAPVPRHVGVVPGKPREVCAVGADPGRRVEVVARDDGDGVAPRQRNDADVVDNRGPAVVLDDADDAFPRWIDFEIRVAHVADRGGQRLRCA